ncbi:MAG: ABC transporter permease [Clostridia bacterium]|nr:ABC transporter permease [Clostridia bacterium]
MKALLLAKRNCKEILREPLCFVFCLGFPALLLIAFRLINYYAGGHWMALSDLLPGVAVFSLSFIMLFMTLLVSKDRATAFLTRLYNAPLSAVDFIVGYALPGILLGVLQSLITYAVGLLVCLIPDGSLAARGIVTVAWEIDYTALPPVETQVGVTLPFGGILTATLAALPVILLFVALGILFGTLLGERAAPGATSALITGAGLLGGAWMPLSEMGGFETFCRILPFYPATIAARHAFMLRAPSFEELFLPLLWVLLWAIAASLLAVLLFRRAMRG